MRLQFVDGGVGWKLSQTWTVWTVWTLWTVSPCCGSSRCFYCKGKPLATRARLRATFLYNMRQIALDCKVLEEGIK